MAVLVASPVSGTGAAPAPVAASAGGDRCPTGPDVFLQVVNGGAAVCNVTIDSVRPCSFGFDHNLAVAVAAGATRRIGPLPASRFASDVDGLAAVTYDQVAGVTVEAITI